MEQEKKMHKKANKKPNFNNKKIQPQKRNTKAPQKKQPAAKNKTNRVNKTNVKPLRIIPLGGLDEIGKNITLYEYGEDMFLVDCGMSFPDEEMPGIDIVIPDFNYVIKNKDKIKGLVLTHGHEDHIGGIPYLLKNFNLPIYGTRLTLGLVEGKLKEHGLAAGAKLNTVKPGDIIKLGAFSVEFIHVNHSIPDAVAVAVRCPAGVVVQTGDFKIDTTPIDDKVIDMARFAQLGSEGVLALLADSTNAERPGFTASERIVGESFSNLFKKADGHRIIVATFSSNIHRIQQIIDEAVRCGRKVAVSGRSMINVVNTAAELGYLKVADGVLIDIESIKKYPPEKLVIITTGS
ncbi:MAG: ribonuclease J, partial [Clostridia bacterium]|nr:ribonuclease J [Clostridia bacterium]